MDHIGLGKYADCHAGCHLTLGKDGHEISSISVAICMLLSLIKHPPPVS